MRLLPVVLVDVALVVVFSVFGRGAHASGYEPAQIWSTAWVFLVGLAVGWAALLLLRLDALSVRAGIVVWLGTIVVGMTIWGVRSGGVPHWSFVLVAALFTALFLVGWRALAGAVRAGRSRAQARDRVVTPC